VEDEGTVAVPGAGCHNQTVVAKPLGSRPKWLEIGIEPTDSNFYG
jgi:hypothetical protein